MKLWKRVGAEFVCIAIVMIFFLPLCGFLFHCGCTYLWTGGLQQCNIHHPAPPDCPWCSGPLYLQIIPFAIVSASGYLGIQLIRRFQRKQFFRDVASGLLVALLIAFFLAWVYAIVLNYPNFLTNRF